MLLSGEVVLIQVHIPLEVATQRKRVENRARSGFLKSCQADFLVLNELLSQCRLRRSLAM